MSTKMLKTNDIPKETLLFSIPFFAFFLLGAAQKGVLLHRGRSSEGRTLYLVPGEMDSMSEELVQY